MRPRHESNDSRWRLEGLDATWSDASSSAARVEVSLSSIRLPSFIPFHLPSFFEAISAFRNPKRTTQGKDTRLTSNHLEQHGARTATWALRMCLLVEKERESRGCDAHEKPTGADHMKEKGKRSGRRGKS